MDSVIQHTKECFICRTTQGLESHHIYYGTDNRHTSEEYGMKVWLCREHHTGANGIHRNPDMDAELKEYGQMIFERKFPDENFRERFGRSYL
jgi:hypothetical protein